MYWSSFFHLYQPPDQSLDILERIVNESYRPLIRDWLANPKAKVTLNINGCLTELLVDNKYFDVIDNLKILLERKQIEITASAKYHPFLPILPKEEIVRQIALNEETNKKIFGKNYQPKGFFPPEMGYSRIVGEVVWDLGYKWIILDEIAFNGKVEQVKYDKLYSFNSNNSKIDDRRLNIEFVDRSLRVDKKNPSSIFQLQNQSSTIHHLPSSLFVFFRERRMSNLIMSAMIRSPESLEQALGDEVNRNRYLITAMDAETFGHHRPGLDQMLLSLYKSEKYKLTTVSELLEYFKNIQELDPIDCCWASNEKEIEEGKNFYLYYNKENKLHKLQKKLIDLAITTINAVKFPSSIINHPSSQSARFLLDRALSCNHMWWSNPDAWWSLEEIEKGAYNLKQAIMSLLPSVPRNDIMDKADSLYRQILDTAFFYQRSGLVRKLHEEKETYKKIPFKKRAKLGEYEALIEILKEEEMQAVARKEYELAIRWRDSRYKLEKDLDIYDFVHIVDQMRAEGKMGRYLELAKKYRGAYNKLSPGQPEK